MALGQCLPVELQEQILKLKAEGLSKAEIGRRTGVSRNTVVRYWDLGKVIPPVERGPQADPVEHERLSPSERAQKQTAEDQLAAARAELREAHRHIAELESIRSAAFGLAEVQPDLTIPPVRLDTKPKRTEEVPLLLTSDHQAGEVIQKDAVDGWNEYSLDIYARRYRRLIERTIEVCFQHTAHPRYPCIYYLRGGDAISGAIHPELEATDEVPPPEAVKVVAQQEQWGIEQLAKAFGRVKVVSVPGNHDRSNFGKPRSKQYVELSFDSLIAWFLECQFRGDKRVEFQVPVSGDALFSVGDWTFLLTHGDRIGSGGGQGYIGPAATIRRGGEKVRQSYWEQGIHVDFVLMGHHHTRLFLENIISNGTLAGYGEYSKRHRFKPMPPSQWLIHVHPTRGISNLREIFVEDELPRRRSA